MNFSEWLEKKFLEWQNQIGKRKTLTAFAKHLGISQPLLSRYLNDGVMPGIDKIPFLAEKLGPEVYEFVNLDTPADPAIRELQAAYNVLPPEEKQEIMQIILDFAERHGYKKVK